MSTNPQFIIIAPVLFDRAQIFAPTSGPPSRTMARMAVGEVMHLN
jgi:hypothetical protein